ncbi:IS110 family transposase [Rhodococcus sp. 11-3]|nr:IS110 family transposase [Rhodococcus sp. 11-3]USC15517.1 IS110 family transposase [Rhodococcus sp. 11-3]
MQVLYQRCAAIDIGKDVIAVAVRVPGDGPDHRHTVKRMFTTFYGVLVQAAAWLTEQQVTHVAMEATGIYSMPVYHALVEHGDFEEVLVCNAGHVRNVPGRKTDLSDAEWLAHLLECGLVRGSFIPPAEIKAARDVIRYRRKLTESRTSELQRLGNVLHDAGIKVDSVASTITTASVRAMVEALIDGQRRPAMLADLAKGKMRAKIPDLQRALEGRFDDHHASRCRLHLDHIDHLEQMIRRLDEQIEDMMQPFRAERELLTTIPGIGPGASAAIIFSNQVWRSPTVSRRTHISPPGSACARATTSRPASIAPVPDVRATRSCSMCSSSAAGLPCGHRATCRAFTAGTSASSAAREVPTPRTKPSSRSPTNWRSSSGISSPPGAPTGTSEPTTSTAESTRPKKLVDSWPGFKHSVTRSPSNPHNQRPDHSNAAPGCAGWLRPAGHLRFTYQPS